MKRPIRYLPLALADVEDHSVYLAGHAGDRVARRFEAGVRRTAKLLLRFPRIGRERQLGPPRLRALRAWSITGFPDVLIFYLVVPGGIDVVRVLHAARDLPRQSFD